MKNEIAFARLPEIDPAEIAAHMSDPRIAKHMPLLTTQWNVASAVNFVDQKEQNWNRDGLGHWAILSSGRYIGWGGLQREGDEWDFGLVLRPDAFGLGRSVMKKAIDFAISDSRIPFATFLLPPSRNNQGALERLGAKLVGMIEYCGESFLKFRLVTAQP